ncbi:CsbD family protein [Nodosilinea nodulosa]|uniref:CsbD family protein n=1 Tax=Nodosilinea nodulosa TaxID=416001 RepID=UPI0002FF4D73|nr:CsbD family protein [Nodosilinea nodulosa]
MSIEDRVKAAAKNAEGKIEEAVGDLTGNHEAQVKGKAKQAEANVRNAAEDIKDQVKKSID